MKVRRRRTFIKTDFGVSSAIDAGNTKISFTIRITYCR